MSDAWVKIYLWALIGCSFIGILLLVFHPISRMLGKPKSNNEYMKAMTRRQLIIVSLQFITGVITAVLFKLDILKGWGVLVFCGVLLIGEFILSLLIKPAATPVE